MTVTKHDERFWEVVPLAEMSVEQWESLCDRCAKCCLEKLEDEDTGQIHYTNVACALLDLDSGHCRDYCNRAHAMPDCITLTVETLRDPRWLPETCAYRLLAEGKPLPGWHPLITGEEGSVAAAGQSIAGRAIPATAAEELAWHLVDWVR